MKFSYEKMDAYIVNSEDGSIQCVCYSEEQAIEIVKLLEKATNIEKED